LILWTTSAKKTSESDDHSATYDYGVQVDNFAVIFLWQWESTGVLLKLNAKAAIGTLFFFAMSVLTSGMLAKKVTFNDSIYFWF